MSKSKPIKTASELQSEMYAEIDKADKTYRGFVAKQEKERLDLKTKCETQKRQIEKKYLTMIEQLEEIDIPFAKAEIERNNLGQ